MTGYEKEKWVELYKAALLELEHAKMHGRIANARESIVTRVAKLHDLPGLHEEERQAIQDALNNLRVLEHEDKQYTMEEERRALEQAQRSLQMLAPKMLRPE